MSPAQPEVSLLFMFDMPVGSPVSLACNFEAQVWEVSPSHPTTMKLLGHVGDRCDDTTMFARAFVLNGVSVAGAFDGATTTRVAVRVRWLIGTRVTCRRVFPLPLLWVSCSTVVVRAVVDPGFVPGVVACSQQPRQGAYFPLAVCPTPLVLGQVPGDRFGALVVTHSCVAPLRGVSVDPASLAVPYSSRPHHSQGRGLLQALDATPMNGHGAFSWNPVEDVGSSPGSVGSHGTQGTRKEQESKTIKTTSKNKKKGKKSLKSSGCSGTSAGAGAGTGTSTSVGDGDGDGDEAAGKSRAGGRSPPPCLYSMAWTQSRAGTLTHTVLALPRAGLYHVEVRTGVGSPCVVAVTEVWDMDLIMPAKSKKYFNRGKTALASYVGQNCVGRLLGLHGGKYLHLFQDADSPVQMWTRLQECVTVTLFEYPFVWRRDVVPLPGREALVQAVRATLGACMRDVPVDSNWREQTLWTNDLVRFLFALVGAQAQSRGGCATYDATLGLAELTEDVTAMARHASLLVAATYEATLGMVAAIAPIPAHAATFIPSYHLGFCLAMLQLPRQCVPKVALDVVCASLHTWTQKWFRSPLSGGVGGALISFGGGAGVAGVAGVTDDRRLWHFVDWAAGAVARGRGTDTDSRMQCTAVVNALWYRTVVAARALWPDPGHVLEWDEVSFLFFPENFHRAFHVPGAPGAYSMTVQSGTPSVHATAEAILSGLCQDRAKSAHALMGLLRRWGPDCSISPEDHAHGGPTFFYGSFVAQALAMCEDVLGPNTASEWVLEFYGPMARKHGTLPEKKGDNASLAHAWSVAIVPYIARAAGDADTKTSSVVTTPTPVRQEACIDAS